MLAYSSLIGAAGAYTGYDLARGNLLGVVHLSDILAALNNLLASASASNGTHPSPLRWCS